eukprot:5913981-Prymnesium_polylepis.1
MGWDESSRCAHVKEEGGFANTQSRLLLSGELRLPCDLPFGAVRARVLLDDDGDGNAWWVDNGRCDGLCGRGSGTAQCVGTCNVLCLHLGDESVVRVAANGGGDDLGLAARRFLLGILLDRLVERLLSR